MMRRTIALLTTVIASHPLAAQSSTLHAQLDWSIRAHSAPGRDVAFSPDSRIIASAGVDSVVRLWNVSNKKLIATLPHPIGVTAIAFTPDGKSIVSGAYDGMVRIWNLDTRSVVRTLR